MPGKYQLVHDLKVSSYYLLIKLNNIAQISLIAVLSDIGSLMMSNSGLKQIGILNVIL
jgi:hypothetical protein